MRHDSPSPGTRPGRAILVALGIWLVSPVAARAVMLLVNGSLLASDGAEGDHLGQAVAVSGDVEETLAKLLDWLEELDDVQDVYHNAAFSD